MGLPELRPFWSQYLLQAQRFNTNSAGVEMFERLHDVRRGPPTVVATYAAVLGLGFQGCYGLPGADRYVLAQLRRDLATQLGVDPDRDWSAGVLKRIRIEDVENLDLFAIPWFKSVWLGRGIGIALLVTALGTLLWRLFG